jgi:hypothetical protein
MATRRERVMVGRLLPDARIEPRAMIAPRIVTRPRRRKLSQLDAGRSEAGAGDPTTGQPESGEALLLRWHSQQY